MPFPSHWLAIALTLVLGAASFCALGVAVASVISNAEAAPAVAQLVLFPLLFLSGTYLPIHSQLLNRIAGWLPVRPFNEALTGPFAEHSGPSWRHLGVLAAWGVARRHRRHPPVPLEPAARVISQIAPGREACQPPGYWPGWRGLISSWRGSPAGRSPCAGWSRLGAGGAPSDWSSSSKLSPTLVGYGRTRRWRRLAGAAIRRTGRWLRPPGFDAVAAVVHRADHGGGRHALAGLDGRDDVFTDIDNQPRRWAAGQPVGDPSPAGPPEVCPGHAGDDRVAQSMDRAHPGEVDALVDALENQAADPAQRVAVATPGSTGHGGADDLGRLAQAAGQASSPPAAFVSHDPARADAGPANSPRPRLAQPNATAPATIIAAAQADVLAGGPGR